MKKIYRKTIPALFILISAGGALRAQVIFPNTGSLLLPELSTAAASSMNVTKISLTAGLLDASGKVIAPVNADVQWRNGAWQDQRRSVVAQLLFPTRILQDKPEIKAQYKLDYEIEYSRNGSPATVKLTETLPADKAASYSAKLSLPLRPAVVDGSGLTWAKSGERSGLLAVKVTINAKASSTSSLNGVFMLKQNGKTKDGMPVNADWPATIKIDFVCAGGRQLQWENSGKDLRQLAPDLEVKLTQPACQ